MELRTARTIIRPWRRSDDDVSDRWPPYSDPLEPLWNLPRAFSSADFWPSGGFSPYDRETWAVDGYDGRLMGRISLREINRRIPQARLGVTFGAPYIGRGLGTEALRRFIQWYFTDMKFAAMVLDVAAPNERAVHCYERLGFAYVSSDWRQAGVGFDVRILDRPPYYHLRRFFSSERRGLFVEFYEMRLDHSRWHQMALEQHTTP